MLAVFNAGEYFPARGAALEAGSFTKSYQINVLGVVFGLVPLVERMRERGQGQVAIIGSASAYRGLPLASAYGATKAALNYMAEALKFDLDKMNIRIQMINPGFIETPFTKNNHFAMPALMPVTHASERIVYGLKTGGFEGAFSPPPDPFPEIDQPVPVPALFLVRELGDGRRKRPRTAGKKSKRYIPYSGVTARRAKS